MVSLHGLTAGKTDISPKLTGVWTDGTGDVFLVGVDFPSGTSPSIVLTTGPAVGWFLMPVPDTFDAVAIWGSSSVDVWACGTSMFHWNGVEWAAVPIPTISGSLKKIWGSGPSDVFAVGDNGVILHWDGITWSAMESVATVALSAVWGTGPNDVFVAGGDSTIGVVAVYHWNGHAWSPFFSAPTTFPSGAGIWGPATNDMYLASNGLRHSDGTSWLQLATDTRTEH